MQSAAQTYFSTDAEDLSLAQSALLAGLIAAPNHFDPFVHPESAYGRRNVVLRLMRRQRMIEPRSVPSGRARADRAPPRASRPSDTGSRTSSTTSRSGSWRTRPSARPGRTDTSSCSPVGCSITTTLDPQMQGYAETAVRELLTYPSDPDGAMTVIDPRTGFVRAMVGGKDADYWNDADAGRVNLATGKGGLGRQTGSAFKPYALVTALENGISPSTVFAGPCSIDIPRRGGAVWHVTNAEGSGYGSMSLASATVQLGEHRLRPADRAARAARRSWRPRSGWACGAARG